LQKSSGVPREQELQSTTLQLRGDRSERFRFLFLRELVAVVRHWVRMLDTRMSEVQLLHASFLLIE
jgi:hypothetical protein